MIHGLEERLGDDGGRGDGAEAGHEEQGRGDEARRRYQQEEQLRDHELRRPRPGDVVADDPNGHAAQDNLEYLQNPREGLEIADVDEEGGSGGGRHHSMHGHLGRHFGSIMARERLQEEER